MSCVTHHPVAQEPVDAHGQSYSPRLQEAAHAVFSFPFHVIELLRLACVLAAVLSSGVCPMAGIERQHVDC